MSKKLFSAAILSAWAFTAAAATPSFNYVEGGYVSTIDSDEDFDGWEIKGSFELSNDFYLTAGYQILDADYLSTDIDADLFNAGIGYKFAITNSTTLFTELEYLHVKLKADNFGSESDDGYQFGAGVRSMLTNNLELKAAAYYQDLDGSDEFIKVGGAYKFNDALSVYLDVDTDFDNSQMMTGVRFQF